ncbi:MAG TPA: PEP-CTERM sorting domain-containing protein [Pyrinomonadaceae bacterium]|nr:PEP-CTERM sorting domain-containing protein [Pyrinomonadaceae bacterium]
MRSRIFRPVGTFISLILLVSVPVQASPIKFADVVNVMGDLHRGSQNEQLRLRVKQDPNTPLSVRDNASQSSSAGVTPSTDGDVTQASADLAATENSSTSLVAGTDIAPDQPQADVQVFDQGTVDGTICDCGEIPAVGGGFPKWPFLLLIPLVCVTGICTGDDKKKIPPPPSTPTPTPEVPEPASLLLLGSGIAALSAGARRRYAKMRASKQAATMMEV